MSMTDLPNATTRRLAQEIADLRRQVDRLTRASRTTQLGNSSIENGTLVARDAFGNIRSTYGRQPDGTFGLGAANGQAPSRPNTLTMTPFPAGIKLGWNGQLAAGILGDFSHLLIHMSDSGANFIRDKSNLVGTLLRAGELPVPLPGRPGPFWAFAIAVNTSGVESEPSLLAGPASPGKVVADSALAGVIDTIALANDAVTAAKVATGAIGETEIAPNSVSSPKIIAAAIQAIHMAVDSIQAGAVAANVITGREIAALSILAGHLTANLIDASHIKAGVVEAVHLAAQIILTSRIILGDPAAARLEIDQFGIAQFSSMGDPTMKLGQDPRGGNFLTVVDPLDSQKALASISDAGVVTASGFAVTGNLSYNGDELSEILRQSSKATVAQGFTDAPSATTSTEIGWFELGFYGEPGRAYRIGSLGAKVLTNPCNLNTRYTNDGTAPSVTSPLLSVTTGQVGYDSTFKGTINDGAGLNWRILFSLQSRGGSTQLGLPGGPNQFQCWIDDMGMAVPFTGAITSGSGTQAPTPTQKTVQWDATWHGTWTPNAFTSSADMKQGVYGGVTNRAAFGFDVANIRSTLSGATINGCQVYLYVNHAYYNSGGYARIRTHNGTNNGAYPPVSGTRWAVKFGKPEGKWVNVGFAVGQEFRDSLTNGFALDATDGFGGLDHYIRVNGSGQSLRPKVKITFTK